MKDKFEGYKIEALDTMAQKIMTNNDEAVAVVLFELDCGCMKVCGASASGGPVGSMILVSIALMDNDTVSICSKCIEDEGSPERIVNFGIMWKNEDGKKPNAKHRQAIFQSIFGHETQELDLENL
jgi:hypothetical protein